MSLEALTLWTLQGSIFLNVLALGMAARASDGWYVLRRPRLLVRSLFAMNVVMPAFAAALDAVFDFHLVVRVTLIALAVSPVPPLLPRRELQAGGRRSYTVGLLVAAALLATALAPIAVAVLGRVFGRERQVPVASLAAIVATSVLVPLAVGLAIRYLAPGAADRFAKPIAVVGMISLAAAVIPIAVATGPAMIALIGNGTVLAFAVFAAVGLAVGHALGGPDPDERAVLALSTATRHPAIAIAVGSAVVADPKPVMGAVLLAGLVSVLVSLPYVRRRPRPGAGVGGAVVDRPPVTRAWTMKRAAR